MIKNIKDLEFNNLTVVDLFCGAGIGAIGIKKAGFKIIYAIDNNKHAVKAYNENIGNHAILGDIKKTEFSSIPDSDLIVAGFPCQPFSFGGLGLGESCDKKGDLGKKFLDIVLEKQPKAFLLENVAGLTSVKHKDFFQKLINEFEKGGYNVNWKLIDCLDYGVPQKRKRVFAIGIRKDLNKNFLFPDSIDKSEYKTIRDYIGDLPEPYSYDKPLENSKLKNHYGHGIRNDEKPFVDQVKIGGNWKDLKIEDQKTFMKGAFYSKGGRTSFLRKVSFEKPAFTITSVMDGKYNAQILDNKDKYKTENLDIGIESARRFTVRECLRLQTVPDSFVFADDIPLRKQYERCSGIPCLVSYIITKEIAELIR